MKDFAKNLMWLGLGLVIVTAGFELAWAVVVYYKEVFITGGVIIGIILFGRFIRSRFGGGVGLSGLIRGR